MSKNAPEVLQSVGSATAIAVGLSYATGFLIVAIHNAEFGIIQFEPLKPRIFLAGGVFWLFVSLVAFIAFRSDGLFGLGGEVSELPTDISLRLYRKACHRVLLFGIFWMFCFVLSFFFVKKPSPSPYDYVQFIAFVLHAVIVTTAATSHRLEDHPKKFLLLSFLITILLPLSTYYFGDKAHNLTAFWLYLVALFSYDMAGTIRSWRRQLRPEGTLAVLSLLLLTYTFFVYGRIRPEFGGGYPIRVQAHFTTALPATGSVSDLFLIDENDNGYYFLTTADPGRAFFVARNHVLTVQFKKEISKNPYIEYP